MTFMHTLLVLLIAIELMLHVTCDDTEIFVSKWLMEPSTPTLPLGKLDMPISTENIRVGEYCKVIYRGSRMDVYARVAAIDKEIWRVNFFGLRYGKSIFPKLKVFNKRYSEEVSPEISVSTEIVEESPNIYVMAVYSHFNGETIQHDTFHNVSPVNAKVEVLVFSKAPLEGRQSPIQETKYVSSNNKTVSEHTFKKTEATEDDRSE